MSSNTTIIVEPDSIPSPSVSDSPTHLLLPSTSGISPTTTLSAVESPSFSPAPPAPNPPPPPPPPPPEADPEDSPLDTAKFLSFEEWKLQNLAKMEQSIDSFESRGAREPRKVPGAGSAALDSVGEDFEIDVGGGDSTGVGENVVQVSASGGGEKGGADGGAGGAIPRSQDAGKTCKERFNYASFDCAATVHKTNKEARSTNSILVESKETYMLNKCSAKEKFFIVELCEDILVDTVVLANFEFFSSVFKELRVSVSDRYPVKANGWRVLGTFIAKNTRDVQAFLIENPLIWARYMKVEILSHYGHEYYCPVSLFRVHGTTMMEEFRHQEEAARGEAVEDVREEIMPEAVADPIKSAENATKASDMEKQATTTTTTKEAVESEKDSNTAVPSESQISTTATRTKHVSVILTYTDRCLNEQLVLATIKPTCSLVNPEEPEATVPALTTTEISATSRQDQSKSSPSVNSHSQPPASASTSMSQSSTSIASQHVPAPSSSSTPTPKPVNPDLKTPDPHPPQPTNNPPSHSVPPNPNPGTQESFFKSVHKRLTHLEGNATLSLQYIESQSRILRDAFAKMERKQIAKVEHMLERLNETAFADLKNYREKYDQLWQSTVIALESHRTTTNSELHALSDRLSLIADEVIFQKRLYQLNTILLLITIGVVIFSRNERLGGPLSQHLRVRSGINFGGRAKPAPPAVIGLESPPNSPTPSSNTGVAGTTTTVATAVGRSLRRNSTDSESLPVSPVESTDGAAASTTNLNPDTANNSINNINPPTPLSRAITPESYLTETRSSPPTPSGARRINHKDWISVGPHLKVEGQGRRWMRLPSPLGSSVDLRGKKGVEVEGEPGEEVYHDQDHEE
ncbi:hypothetical protein EX30DRAFT_369935 [Ascodesmis nigricans]|uniref:SUN-like protein 1 n=1 Tax=Ascodesmis nigricans TaxID=341454 RepID=A0A4S2N1K6_9PEZI|nr:hypothetical protein EX30DRAFT_369935 [Ascodesmis nigricans]